MLGDDEQSLYVVFMGTKHMRDLLSDANFLQEAVWTSKDPDKQQQVISTSLHPVEPMNLPELYPAAVPVDCANLHLMLRCLEMYSL